MPFRSLRLLTLVTATCLALPLYAARADISGAATNATSLGGDTTTTAPASTGTINLTSNDLLVLQQRRSDVQTKIITLQTDIIALTTKAATGDTTATTQLTKSQTDLKEMQEIDKAIAALIQNSTIINDPVTGGTDTSSSGSSSDDSASSGGGMSSGTDALKEMLMGAIMQKLMGGGNLSDITQGFQSLLNGGTIPGMGAGTSPATTGSVNPTEVAQKPQTPEPEQLPPCGPGSVPPTPRGSDTASNPGKAKDDNPSGYSSRSTGSTTADNPGKAKDDYIGPAPKSQTEANPGKAADDVIKSVTPCRVVDYKQKNPYGTGKMETGADTAGNAATSKKITSIEDAQKYVGKYMCDPSNSNCAANAQQCASLTKYFCGVGSASSWQAGAAVKGNSSISPGTCIATANYNGKYGPSNAPGGVSGGSHTGVYLGQNEKGVIMLHQWSGSGGAKISVVPWSSWGKTGKEGGNYYYTISGQSAFLGFPVYLPSLAESLHLMPAGEGLAFTGKITYNDL